jgi:hypothetical protein
MPSRQPISRVPPAYSAGGAHIGGTPTPGEELRVLRGRSEGPSTAVCRCLSTPKREASQPLSILAVGGSSLLDNRGQTPDSNDRHDRIRDVGAGSPEHASVTAVVNAIAGRYHCRKDREGAAEEQEQLDSNETFEGLAVRCRTQNDHAENRGGLRPRTFAVQSR